jgi:ABC-type polar amino acid transport system ATPase subunit
VLAAPGRVLAMLRHVVLFTWSDAADEERRRTTIEALRRLRQDVGGMSMLIVAEDADLADGNADAVLIADFPDVQAYYRYAQDPVHLAVIAEHVRPWLKSRSALQYQI